MDNLESLCKITENEIVFNKDFFQRVFIKPSIKNNKSLSGVSLRLAFILLQELNVYYPTEIPQRNSLANTLGVSRTAVINGLAQLEEQGFLIREPSSAIAMICSDEKEQEEINKFYEKQKVEEMKKRDFSGKFYINQYYNQDNQELNTLELIKGISDQSIKFANDFLYREQMETRLRAVENRIKKIEDVIKKK